MARKRNIKLIKLRKGREMTQIEVAKQVGVTPRTYGKAEAGKNVNDTTKALIADFFNLPEGEIFTNTY